MTLVVLLRAGHLGAGTELHWLQLSLAVAVAVPVAVGLVGGVAIFLLLGGQDPVRSVWDLRDERQPSG